MEKDIKEILSSRKLLGPVFIPQISTCFILPAVVLLLGYVFGDALIRSLPFLADTLLKLYTVPAGFTALYEQVLYVIANYTFIPLLMMMPLQAAMIISVNSLVGEKQKKTLETLLYTPVSNKELVTAKLFGVLIPAVILTLLECLIYFIICNSISFAFSGKFILYSPAFITAVLIFNPAASSLGLSIIMMISVKANSYAEAEQVAGIFVLPFITLMVTQVVGLYTLTSLQIVVAGILLFLVSYFLMARATPRFQREDIIKTF